MNFSLLKYHDKITFYYDDIYISKQNVIIYLINSKRPYLNMKNNCNSGLYTVSSYFIDKIYELKTY